MKYTYEDGTPFTKEEFLEKLETDNEFNEEFGNKGIDQITNLINDLKTNPDSRRLMVNAWNVGELDKMVLPPCHYGFQIYTRELSLDERMEFYYKNNLKSPKQESISRNHTNEQKLQYLKVAGALYPIPTRAISLMWNQRSCDFPLGIPMNIASYGLLLEIISKEVNMVPDELIGNFGDCHIYLNQIDGVKEQIGRNSYELPKVKINERNWYIHKEVKKHLGEKTFDEKLKSYRPDCFELIGYESHPKIYFPLSN